MKAKCQLAQSDTQFKFKINVNHRPIDTKNMTKFEYYLTYEVLKLLHYSIKNYTGIYFTKYDNFIRKKI